MKRKKLVLIVTTLLVFIIVGIAGKKLYDYKCNKDRLKKPPYFTELHIDFTTVFEMKTGYCVKMTP